MSKKILSLVSVLMIFGISLLSGCARQTPAAAGEKTGIIGAMDVEVNSLKEAAENVKTTTISGMDFCEGTLSGKNVVIVKCDMGKVNAGICAQTLIREFGCTKIINTGVAGSLDERLEIGDIVVSTDAVQHDFDVTYIGYAKGEIPYTGLYAFPADEEMRKAAVEAVKECAPEVSVYEGRICSGDRFIHTEEQKERITSDFGGMCCEMEGAAIAQVCHLNEVPFVVIRAVSDKVGETTVSDYQAFEAEAAERCAGIVMLLVERF